MKYQLLNKHVFVNTKDADDTLELVSPEKNPFDQYQTQKKIYPGFDNDENYRFSQTSKLNFLKYALRGDKNSSNYFKYSSTHIKKSKE